VRAGRAQPGVGVQLIPQMKCVACHDLATRMEMRIGWLRLIGDVARLHVKIDNLNDSLVGFCFTRSIDW
jgi:hypothetical protein